ncbi:MAG: HAD-IA family hydrolase, partial [Deltaproteobacteria bacterium]|nr:HAD-IA family hydrolase [Deltaproteobacteria bacterium]
AGRREAAGFLAVPWVEEQLREKVGFVPFPGTLNVRLGDADSLEAWAALRRSEAPVRLVSPDPAFCDAGAYPVRLNGAVFGAAIVPVVEGYYPDVVEVVAAEGLRVRFGLGEGDPCSVEPLDRVPELGSAGRRKGAVLFDFEGTLVDFQWLLADAEAELRGVLADLGFDLAPFAKDNYAVLRTRALDQNPSEAVRGELERRFGEIYDRYDLDALSRWALRPGAAELLARLRADGVKMSLISNVGRAALHRALEKFGLSSAFDAVISRNEMTRAKPSGEGLRRAMELLGASPADTLMVGDSFSDLYAARDAGVEVAILLGGENPPADIERARPDHVVASLLAVATFV